MVSAVKLDELSLCISKDLPSDGDDPEDLKAALTNGQCHQSRDEDEDITDLEGKKKIAHQQCSSTFNYSIAMGYINK